MASMASMGGEGVASREPPGRESRGAAGAYEGRKARGSKDAEGGGMITAILIISLANLALQVLAAWQRHQALEHQKQNGGAAP